MTKNDQFLNVNVMTPEDPQGQDRTISLDQAIMEFPEIESALMSPGFHRLGAIFGDVAIEIQVVTFREPPTWTEIMPGVYRVERA